MTRLSVKCMGAAALCFALSTSLTIAQDETAASSAPKEKEILRIAEAVRKQIVTLPQYGVFDYIHFAIKGSDTVVLQGKASRPTLKSSAESAVKKIEGVTNVDNQIQVLPVSP